MDDPENDPAGSVKSDPELYTSVKRLAAALQVSRPTIYAWLELPSCPGKTEDGRFEVAAWKEFAKKIGSKTAVAVTEDKSLLQARELDLICRRREFDLAVKQREYTHNELITAQASARCREAATVLRAKFERELPSLYTLDAAHNLALNKAAIDEVCERLSTPLPCQEEHADL